MQTLGVAALGGRVDGEKVRHYINRLGNLHQELADIRGTINACLDEAENAGLDRKVMKAVEKRSRKDRASQMAFDTAVWEYEAQAYDAQKQIEPPEPPPAPETVAYDEVPLDDFGASALEAVEVPLPEKPKRRSRKAAGEYVTPQATEVAPDDATPLANGQDVPNGATEADFDTLSAF